jgi:hypothetical protein
MTGIVGVMVSAWCRGRPGTPIAQVANIQPGDRESTYWVRAARSSPELDSAGLSAVKAPSSRTCVCAKGLVFLSLSTFLLEPCGAL